MTGMDTALSRNSRHREEIMDELTYLCDPKQSRFRDRTMLSKAKIKTWALFYQMLYICEKR